MTLQDYYKFTCDLTKKSESREFSLDSLYANLYLIKYFYFNHIRLLAIVIAKSITNVEEKNTILKLLEDE